jgi:DNA-binding CsgD family transcriptional regulator
MQLGQAGSEGDVMSIFKKNREIFDQLKLQSEAQYAALMNVFKKTKAKFKEQA